MPQIKLTAKDSHTLSAYMAEPSGTPISGLVVIQEIFGVNGHIKAVCDSFADEGFLAIAPALFERNEKGVELDYNQKGFTKGKELKAAISYEDALKDITAAVKYLQQKDLTVSTIGYCWGGSLAWLSATRISGLARSIGYYGSQIIDHAAETPKCPTMLHFGENDASIPPKTVAKIRDAHPEVQIYTYPADHGFNCNERAQYNEEAALVARERSLTFLKTVEPLRQAG